ncbi:MULTISPECIES: hypothetical protein [Streptomyces]|uniref:hypothetical protein n=1 Tax=Streptomyces TaxID=1883 RepID=UPI00293081A1|nr:hypothetical protein [Streptomyces sp. NEAU-HV9]
MTRLLTVLVFPLTALVASLAWVTGKRSGPTGHGLGSMMGIISLEQQVHSMADADRVAGRFAARWSLHVGEVMWFSNGYTLRDDHPISAGEGH